MPMADHLQHQGAAATVSSALDRFTIFTDEPLFADTRATDRDAFNHEAFAETILKLLLRNKPPLSIGLFGGWGIGKSTIINILRAKIREKHSDTLKDIYFNAWKYSGDSFRRQFLIEVARQIYGDEHEEVRRLQQLNYSEVLRKSHQQSLAASLVRALKDAFSVKFAFRGSAVARVIIGCTSVLLCVVLSDLVSKWSPLFAGLSLTISVTGIFVWFSGMKFDEIFVLHEEPIYDPKLIFPEQFEAEFGHLARSTALRNRKLVIAIDDIDRCEPAAIKDILICAKNFIGHENCFFIVPCDEKTVVDIFSEPSQKEGYKDESLRKYFNVTLRIPPITSTDLVDFANTVARQTGIPDEIVQIAILANCRDARKMKHFLNSLEMKYQVAKAREAAGLMPAIVDNNLAELAKVVLIENAYPELFSKVVENPRIFQLLEKAALEPLASRELETYGLANWEGTYPGLREILQKTRETKMTHSDVFFPLKSTNTEVRVPRGTELKTAVIEGSTQVIEEIASHITEPEAKVATADLLLDLLGRSTGPFLRNVISAGLKLYCFEGFFSRAEKLRVGREVIRALRYRASLTLLSLSPDELLRCASEVGSAYLEGILQDYYDALEKLPQSSIPENSAAIVLALYKFATDRKRFASLLNGKLESWSDSPQGLAVLDDLSSLNSFPRDEKIPTVPVVLRILRTLEEGASKFVPADAIRRKILFANWEKEIGEPFVQMLTSRLKVAQSDVDYGSEVEFVISSIISKPELVTFDPADDLWPLLPPLYENLSNEKGKPDVARAAMLFAARSGNGSTAREAAEFVLRIWRDLTDVLLRSDVEFVASIGSSQGKQLLKQGVEQELGLIAEESKQPTERSLQRVTFCVDYSDNLEAGALEGQLLETLNARSAEVLRTWVGAIKGVMIKLEATFPNSFASRCLERVSAIPEKDERQNILLDAFVGVLPTLSSDDRRSALREYFSLMKDPGVGTRDIAASRLRAVREASSDSQDFRLTVGNLIKHIRDKVSTEDLPQFFGAFRALMVEEGLLGEYQNRDIADMAKKLMSHADDSLQDLGLQLVEHMPNVHNDDQAEIIHLLITIAGSSGSLATRASERLRKFLAADLAEGAREQLESWRKSA
jgi:KAP family P-loop domain